MNKSSSEQNEDSNNSKYNCSDEENEESENSLFNLFYKAPKEKILRMMVD